MAWDWFVDMLLLSLGVMRMWDSCCCKDLECVRRIVERDSMEELW